jgi:protein TonB
MREIFKAYSLSFLIHSLLLFGFFLLTQRLVPSEKRLIEIDLSLENLQRQPQADLPQKAQPLPARPPQTQPVPQATMPPMKEEIKSSTAKQLKQEEKQSQVQSPPKPTEAEIREIQTSKVQTAPQPKEETKGQTTEHPVQGERLLQAKETSQKPRSQERQAESQTQTQPVPQATIPPTKEEIKSSTAKQLKQEERLIQATNTPKPTEAEIREIQTSKVQTAPQPKEETKGQTTEHSVQGERLLQAKETSQKPRSQEREGKDLQAQTNKSVESPSRPTSSSTQTSPYPSESSKLTDESRRVALEESFLRERLSVISNIVQRRINYPPIARRMGWEGKVLVSFVLEPNGDIRDLKLLKGSGYEVLDKEALDAIRRSYRDFPKPTVSVVVKLPISFRLE